MGHQIALVKELRVMFGEIGDSGFNWKMILKRILGQWCPRENWGGDVNGKIDDGDLNGKMILKKILRQCYSWENWGVDVKGEIDDIDFNGRMIFKRILGQWYEAGERYKGDI